MQQGVPAFPLARPLRGKFCVLVEQVLVCPLELLHVPLLCAAASLDLGCSAGGGATSGGSMTAADPCWAAFRRARQEAEWDRAVVFDADWDDVAIHAARGLSVTELQLAL
jgi:hypothetical protein